MTRDEIEAPSRAELLALVKAKNEEMREMIAVLRGSAACPRCGMPKPPGGHGYCSVGCGLASGPLGGGR